MGYTAGDKDDILNQDMIIKGKSADDPNAPWKNAWLGKTKQRLDDFKTDFPDEPVTAIAIAGGAGCNWEREQLYNRFTKLYPNMRLKQCGDLEDYASWLDKYCAGQKKHIEPEAKGKCDERVSVGTEAVVDTAAEPEVTGRGGCLWVKGAAQSENEIRILILGLDSAGKTTILYKLRLGEIVTTIIPTVGFNVETMKYKNLSVTFWDIGGADALRPSWRHYYQGTEGLIYIVDSNDRNRIETARVELWKALDEEQMLKKALLVFANKQDLPNAMSVADLTDKLGLHSMHNCQWFIQAACAPTGDGLYEGLEWLSRAVSNNKKRGLSTYWHG